MTTYLPDKHHAQASRLHAAASPRLVRAEVSTGLLDPNGQLIDWLVDFTLGTLDGQHVEIRVLPALPDRLVVTTSHHNYPLSERAHCAVL